VLFLGQYHFHIWRERNARLHDEAFRNNSIVYSDIVSKVNLFHNMVSSDTNRRLHILWGFSDDISFFVDLFLD